MPLSMDGVAVSKVPPLETAGRSRKLLTNSQKGKMIFFLKKERRILSKDIVPMHMRT